MAKGNIKAQRDLGRIFSFLDVNYKNLMTRYGGKEKIQRQSQNILDILDQLNDILNELGKLEKIKYENYRDILSELASLIAEIQSNHQNEDRMSYLDLSSLFDNDNSIEISEKYFLAQQYYEQLQTQLKDAFVMNLDIQQSFQKNSPEFFDFISVQSKDANNTIKTELFMLDSQQLKNFINNKNLIEFIPNRDHTDFDLKLKRTAQNKEAFDQNLLKYLRGETNGNRNAYFLSNDIADQVFNLNSTYQAFITEKMYDKKVYKDSQRNFKENANTGLRQELMLKQLLNGQTVESAYQNGEGSLWNTETRLGKVRNLGESKFIIRDQVFGGAMGDVFGGLLLNRDTGEFTFANQQYRQGIQDLQNFKPIYGNFQIKNLNTENKIGNISFGSASSILANNLTYANEKNFNAAKEAYRDSLVDDLGISALAATSDMLGFQNEISNAKATVAMAVESLLEDFPGEVTNLGDAAMAIANDVFDITISEW